ncbi:MAG: inositol monophosphatase [Bdellovibrionales bacterium]|nr:inositol monophosphatase [Bdellovibrionales bacterium]
MPKPSAPKLDMEYEALLAYAVEAAFEAGKVMRKHFTRKLRVREKGKLGLVTNADIEAEAVALKVLKKAQPHFALLTEETHSKGTMGSKDLGMWIVDPLDGTTNFVHRFPMFCTTIAAQVGKEIVAAVTYHPILDDLYTAVRGKGAYVNGTRMKVSSTAKICESLLSTGFTYQQHKALHTEMSSFEKLSGSARAVRRPGSAALDLAYTARGVFDGFWERHLSPWDVAAGSLLVSEAGGMVTDFDGDKFNAHGDEVLASNGLLHKQIMRKI